ncbi:predicted protein [Verticillium alfalfae VaMs.102]|uniref:Predicted protein n=1 Tax=Verticillium alfalfae (strain VaMs.102 / ATCC MYA-4576 / FGSC 10136) TaxID=526221 RepID=C9SNU1_VERA1|nr:predicted protein [Verticillium alfalfae VaMs.102]EEY20456.1 predicted protein [Verticillium alfalfae VaMs.102]
MGSWPVEPEGDAAEGGQGRRSEGAPEGGAVDVEEVWGAGAEGNVEGAEAREEGVNGVDCATVAADEQGVEGVLVGYREGRGLVEGRQGLDVAVGGKGLGSLVRFWHVAYGSMARENATCGRDVRVSGGRQFETWGVECVARGTVDGRWTYILWHDSSKGMQEESPSCFSSPLPLGVRL